MEKILLTPHISFTSTLTLYLYYQTKQMFLQTSSTASQIKIIIFNEFILIFKGYMIGFSTINSNNFSLSFHYIQINQQNKQQKWTMTTMIHSQMK